MKKIIIIFSVLFLVVSCSTKIPTMTENKEKMPIYNTSWVLDDDSVSDVTITMGITRNKLGGNSGCNVYSAELNTATDGLFIVKNTISTRKTCDKIATESYYLSLLQRVDNYQATDTSLELYQGNVLLLKFRKK